MGLRVLGVGAVTTFIACVTACGSSSGGGAGSPGGDDGGSSGSSGSSSGGSGSSSGSGSGSSSGGSGGSSGSSSGGADGGGTDGGPNTAGLHVVGNQLVDGTGKAVKLHGVNRSGTEYACVQMNGIFDGPSDDASVAAIASWNSNIVRVPLNEDCWLGINGVQAAYAGAAYQDAITSYVKLLHMHGMYAELSLIWAAPGTNLATNQPSAPDEDHSPAFWTSLATTFKGDPNVILAPWGETTVSAGCFLAGGNCGATYGSSNTPFTSAGMQQAVTLMRQAGYGGVISIPGVSYANDLSMWLATEPKDPLNQIVAEAHIYGKNTCDTTSCFDMTLAPVAMTVPLIFGETGETYDGSDCNASYITTFLTWADAHGVGYETWTWDTWGGCGVLISDYTGTPGNAWATYVKTHYAGL